MYKILLATNDQKVRDAFSAVAWENLGFKQPRMASTVEEAIASLKAYHADAIAIALPAQEDSELIKALMARFPNLPVMEAPDMSGEAEIRVLELRKLWWFATNISAR